MSSITNRVEATPAYSGTPALAWPLIEGARRRGPGPLGVGLAVLLLIGATIGFAMTNHVITSGARHEQHLVAQRTAAATKAR
jgi:hypothetical protein